MADHVGVYEIRGAVVPAPTTKPVVENAYINPTLPQTVVVNVNRRTFDRRTILRFANSASSVVPESTGNIPYSYGHGNITPTPASTGSVMTATIGQVGDVNYSFVIGEFPSPTSSYEDTLFGVWPSATEPIENTPIGVNPNYTPRRTTFYRTGNWRAAPPIQYPGYTTGPSGSIYKRNRTMGITDSTSSDVNTIAVFTRLTGSIMAQLSAAGSSTFPSWYLGTYLSKTVGYVNGAIIASYGGTTPFLPIHSGAYSGSVDPGILSGSQDPIIVDTSASVQLLQRTIDIPTIVPPANDVTALLNREDYTQTTDERWQQAVAPTSSSGNYFGV